MVVRLFWLVVLITSCWPAAGLWAQEAPDAVVEALEGKVNRFMEGISTGKTQAAFDTLLAGSRLLSQEEALKSLTSKTNAIPTRFGTFHAFEKIASKRVGSDLVVLHYLYKCEHFPVVWHFAFYRTPQPTEDTVTEGNSWKVVIVRFDTDLESLGW